MDLGKRLWARFRSQGWDRNSCSDSCILLKSCRLTVPKAYQIPANIPVSPLLTQSNLFRVNGRWLDRHPVKVSGPTIRIPLSGHPQVLSGRPDISGVGGSVAELVGGRYRGR